jgi:signal transduction histidine kinase
LPDDAPVDYGVFLSTVHPDDRERVDAQVRGTQLQGGEYHAEYRGVDGGGHERWLEARGRVLSRDREGRASRFIGTVLDITARKRAEIENARVAEFRERFVGIVSHDLRGPLNAIRMAAEITRMSGELPGSLHRYPEVIVDNVDRMARMIADLLDLTRGRLGGGIPVQPRRANLHEIVLAALETAGLARPGRKIVTETRGDLDGAWDPDRIRQAIGNLLTNALDHGAPHSLVRLELVDQGDRVSIAVHNDGPPIASDQLPHIFEPFRGRVAGSGAGLGLGLFIVSEIARAHGGRVEASSTAEGGTTFRIALPRHP